MGGVGTQIGFLSSAERDDPADRVVGGDADCDPVTGHHLDAEAPHPSAQLREHFMAGVTLDPVQPAGMHGDDCPLHIYKIVFAQSAHPFKKLAMSVPQSWAKRKSIAVNYLR
jgi:hypothetical protein